jgi:hypothetical protein
MGCCYVVMRGKDREIHSVTLDASSAYDGGVEALPIL